MALEWLKSILGDSYTEEADKKISEEIGKGFVARGDFNSVNEAKKGLETQLKTANEAIEGFKGLDIEGVKKAAEDWKAKAEQAERDAAEKVAALQFDTLLDGAIRDARGKNGKAVKALLDVDALRASKNQAEDIKTALDTVAKENGYLFGEDAVLPPYAAGTGMAQSAKADGVEASFYARNPTLAPKG